jgi:hypothetical protein
MYRHVLLIKVKKTPSNIVFLTETKTVMLRFLRLTRANHQTIPQAYCLIACAFTPPLALFTSLLKKTHPYPFRFFLPCRSTLRLPRLRRGRALPSLVPRAHSAATHSCPSVRAARSLLTQRWCRWCSRHPLGQPKPGADGGSGGGARC